MEWRQDMYGSWMKVEPFVALFHTLDGDDEITAEAGAETDLLRTTRFF
jgi:hypothetical protein